MLVGNNDVFLLSSLKVPTHSLSRLEKSFAWLVSREVGMLTPRGVTGRKQTNFATDKLGERLRKC